MKHSFYKISSIGLAIGLLSLSCGKTNNPNPSPPPTPSNSAYKVFFNSAYRPTVDENKALAQKDMNNPDKEIMRLIDSAKESINLANYEIQSVDMANKLIEKAKSGVKIKIVTDTDHLKYDSIKKLKDEKIIIKDDKRDAFMHHKFMVIDNTIVTTGSINFTDRSLYEHNNDLLEINSKELAENYNVEFSRLFDKGLFSGKDHSVPNPDISLQGITSIKTYFSPDGGIRRAIINEIKNAKKSIKFMVFSFTQKDIGEALVEKAKEKINVEGIFDTCQIDKYSIFDDLKKAKLNVFKDGNQALMHEKTIIIDDNIVITGSYNFSVSAEVKNNENELVINSTELAKIYLDEYERLKRASFEHTSLPPYDHPACKGVNPN